MATLAQRVARRDGGTYWLPRSLHPVAWWLWGLGMAVAASRTTNPLLLGAVLGVVTWVVLARRSDAPWANAFRLYVYAGIVVIVIRIVFRIIFGGGEGDIGLVPLPEIALPKLMAGIHLFGDITAESMLGGFYDGLRLATMLICLGAANALANPRRLLRSMPPALHEVSTAVVVALSVFPQLAESVVRVSRARRLRPSTDQGRMAGLRSTIIPVLEDALDRSLMLAASMDSRGYGRSGTRSKATSVVSGVFLCLGLAGICVGVYGLLDATTPRILATPMLVTGIVVGVVGIRLSARGVERSTYRPDRWRVAELMTVASGVAAAALVTLTSRVDPTNLNPSLSPLEWPQLAVLPLTGILLGLVPAFATPVPASVESPA
jgi:energy-coupling factor transport system permease protein